MMFSVIDMDDNCQHCHSGHCIGCGTLVGPGPTHLYLCGDLKKKQGVWWSRTGLLKMSLHYNPHNRSLIQEYISTPCTVSRMTMLTELSSMSMTDIIFILCHSMQQPTSDAFESCGWEQSKIPSCPSNDISTGACTVLCTTLYPWSKWKIYHQLSLLHWQEGMVQGQYVSGSPCTWGVWWKLFWFTLRWHHQSGTRSHNCCVYIQSCSIIGVRSRQHSTIEVKMNLL